jgi:ATP-dependent exoDNAse (exonuclease V) beta subunit
MDRVIFEADRVWVIDYKTGTDQEAEKEYVSQLKNYIRILNEIYSERNVEGVLAYVDLKEVKKVIRS